ncbi:MAG: double-strand break repair protein AddB [Parvibaculaceae bacterium]|nr:double-strand break repair protein AddB [Parvibaculaceae bacterium]
MREIRPPRLFTIPAGEPFLDRLAQTLLDDPSRDGMFAGKAGRLEDLTILVPTRRAARALQEAFLRAGEGKAMLLPSIRPLGDVEEEELVLSPGLEAGDSGTLLDLAPAISPIERQLLLARLILKAWSDPSLSHAPDAARALALAGELGALLDLAATEQVPLSGLAALVPEGFAAHWQVTLDFLQIITEYWPAILAERGMCDGAERRNRLLTAQAEAWEKSPPAGPVIAAGSTGSIPASARLLDVIAHLPSGAVVLPGLDLDLDEASWTVLGASHPQYGMHELLRRMGAGRDEVKLWPGLPDDPRQKARTKLVSETMRPAETTERWRGELATLAPLAGQALDGIRLVEAPGPREEAGAIALMIRETLETPEKTVALVTPDRRIARRVAAELRRFGLDVDDSSGTPLGSTPPGAFARLAIAMIESGFAPVPLLACLKHPFAALGLAPAQARARVRLLERLVLRGPRPAPGLAGLSRAIEAERRERQKRDHGTGDLDRLDPFIRLVEEATRPFTLALGGEGASLSGLVRAHVACIEALARTDEADGAAMLWAGENGEAAVAFLNELIEQGDMLGPIEPDSYPRLFDELILPRVVRPRFGRHPRAFIWGPLEARLQYADRFILAGLNEGVWPGQTSVDAWINRPMREALHLSPPERRIGLAAHDFCEGVSAREVILVRSLKDEGAPAVASRWLLRLQSLLEGLGRPLVPVAVYGEWAEAIDATAGVTPIGKPRPCPPLDMRPGNLSVTEVETLVRDPYAIYAKKVLRLRPLDPLDADATAAERGNIIHEVLERFVREWPEGLPQDALGKLLRIGGEVFREAMDRPAVAAFWWPRFVEAAGWFIGFEQRHRPNVRRAHVEVSGEYVFEDLARPVTLRGKADRIDECRDGTLAILDYKTGAMRSWKQVESGLAPQLPLEAAMAARGAFREAGVPSLATSLIGYLHLKGGDEGGVERLYTGDAAMLGEEALESLEALLASYENPAQPYLSRPRPMFETSYGDYDHLARVKEWSAGEGNGE